VQRKRRHPAIANESTLDTVAVVRVDVHVQHPQPLPAQTQDRQHRVVDVAETARGIRVRVVHAAGRTERDHPFQQHLRAQDAAVGRGRGRGEEAGKVRVLEVADVVPLAIAVRDPALGFALAQCRDVLARVEPLEFRGGGRARHAEFLRGQGAIGMDQVQRQRDARNAERVVAAVGMTAVACRADQHRPAQGRNHTGFGWGLRHRVTAARPAAAWGC